MSNILTGDFEAVLQVANRQMLGLLGTLHQNGFNRSNPLSLAHSETGRIGDPRRERPVTHDTGTFADWVTTYQRSNPTGLGLDDVQKQLIATAPPGAAKRLADAFTAWRDNWAIEHIPPLPTVRGLVKIQLSNVGISVASGSSTEVIVTASIRARYYADQNARELPAPIHGNVEVTFRVRKVSSQSGSKLLIVPSTDDTKIKFVAAAGSGLSTSDEINLSAEVRKALRDSMTPAPAALPKDFPFSDFKGVGIGALTVLALPFQLSNAPTPSSGVQTLTQSFIGSSGFAIAINAAYIRSRFNLVEIKQSISNVTFRITVSVGITSGTATYHLRFTSGPTLTFMPGGFEITGKIAVETDAWWAPNGAVSFRQIIGLRLDVSSQTISPVRIGEPDVDESWFIPHQRVVNAVKTHIDSALSRNATPVRSVFANGKTTLTKALQSLDPGASVNYSEVEVNPNGVIVRGEIGSGPRRAPVIAIGETERACAFTAFESWIPGGRIDRFIWSWVEHRQFVQWGGVEKYFIDEHCFIFLKPANAKQLSQICLRIEGTQISPGGQAQPVIGGTTCSIDQFELALVLPSWWGPVTLPIWQADADDQSPLRNAIAADVSLSANKPDMSLQSRNAVIHFADLRSDQAIESLYQALAQTKQNYSPLVVVVLPVGSFDLSRAEIEKNLRVKSDANVSFHFTEDYEGGWSQAFGVQSAPATFMMNNRRQFVWEQLGALVPADLAAALDQNLGPAPIRQFRPLRLCISQGDTAPDLWLEADDKEQFALSRLRGREVLLTFWQSWSSPCLSELSRLQRLSQAKKNAPFIVAIHGGSDDKANIEIKKRLGLSFALVQDADQRIARQYGVRCWPTTMLIDSDGRVSQIWQGFSREGEFAVKEALP